MYPSIVSLASSKWKDLHTWKYCSLVLPNFEYFCLKHSCRPAQSNHCCCAPNVSYHNLASSERVKWNLHTFWSSGKWCVVIQPFVLSKCASAFSSGFPEKSGLKWDQFNWLFAIDAGRFGKEFGLFGSSGSSGPSAGMSRGWFSSSGPSAGRSTSWFGGNVEIYFSRWFFWIWAYYYSSFASLFLVTCSFTFTFYLCFMYRLCSWFYSLGCYWYMCTCKCTDFNLILDPPVLDVDVMGLSAIRHSTIHHILSIILSKNKIRSLIHICS